MPGQLELAWVNANGTSTPSTSTPATPGASGPGYVAQGYAQGQAARVSATAPTQNNTNTEHRADSVTSDKDVHITVDGPADHGEMDYDVAENQWDY